VVETFAAMEEDVAVQLQLAVNRYEVLEILDVSVFTRLTNGKYLFIMASN
jgi:hypothetical protein